MFIVKHKMKSYRKLMHITIVVVLLSLPSLKVIADGGDDDDDDDGDVDVKREDYVPAVGDCKQDSDCQNTQKCWKNKCFNVCHLPRKIFKLKCSYAAVCYVSEAHTAGCQCLSGYTGDPYEGGCEQAARTGKKVARLINSGMRFILGTDRTVRNRKGQHYML